MGLFDANTVTTTQTPSVLPGLEGLVQPLAGGALGAYNQPFQSYGGQMVAPFNSTQNAAFQGFSNNYLNPATQDAFRAGIGSVQGAGTPSNYWDTAMQGLTTPAGYQSISASPTAYQNVNAPTFDPQGNKIATSSFDTQALQRLMDPYLQGVVNTATSEMDRSAGKNQAALKAQLAAKGSFGDRGTLALSEQQRNAEQTKANTIANLYAGGYGQALSQFNADQTRGLTAAQANQNTGLTGNLANQAALLKALQGNQSAGLTAGINDSNNMLTAGRANQSAGLTADQLSRQGLTTAGGLDVANRGLGVTAGTALGQLGAGAQGANQSALNALLGSGTVQQQGAQAQNTADYAQFMRQLGYPAQQNTNLASILYGAPKGATTQTPTASTGQQLLGGGTALAGILAGSGALNGAGGWLSKLLGGGNGLTAGGGGLGTGGGVNPDGTYAPDINYNGGGLSFDPGSFENFDPSVMYRDGGRVNYANGGAFDDDDDPSDYGDDEADEGDEAQGPDAGGGSASPGAFDDQGGGSDNIQGGAGDDPVGRASSLTDRLRMSGFSGEDLQKAMLAMQPQPVSQSGSLFAGGVNNPITALGLGILGSKSPNIGQAIGEGGGAALTMLDKQTALARANELARQKQALAQATLIGKAVEGDNKAFNTGLTEETKETGRGARAADLNKNRSEVAAGQNAARLQAAAGNNAATMGAAGIHANATLQAAQLHAQTAGMSPVGKLMRDMNALPKDDPQRAVYEAAISKATKDEHDTELGKTLGEMKKIEEANPNDPRIPEYKARVGILTRPMGPEEEGAAKHYYDNVVPAATVATNNLPKIQMARTLLADTGKFADAKLAIGGFLDALGIDGARARDARDLQKLTGIISDVVLSKQLEQKGVQTEGDATRISQTLGTIKNTQEANDFLMRSAQAQANRALDQQAFFEDFYAKNRTRSGADAAWKSSVRNIPLITSDPQGKPIFYNEYRDAMRKANPGAADADIIQMWVKKAK